MAAPAQHLILVKHAAPTIVPGVPAARWVLSATGRAAVAPLAARLSRYDPTTLATSDEPKARETAQGLAAALGFGGPVALDHDLREHERRASDFFQDHRAFQAAMCDLFARPEALVFGRETAAAIARFDAAIARLLASSPAGDVLVVAHGTVLTLFAALHAGLEPFPLWQSLQLPAYVVFTRPGLRWVETVSRIDG